MNSSKRYIWILMIVTFVTLSCEAEIRKWQDATGRFTVEAELVEVREDVVVLRKEGGSIVEVPLAKLSAADHAYLDPIVNPAAPPVNPVSPGSGEAANEEKEEEKPPAGFWDKYRATMETFDKQGEQGKRVIRRLQRMAGFLPEWIKRPATPFVLLLVGAGLFPFAYIWILKHEFSSNPGWGIAQIGSDMFGCCFAPMFGSFITLIFGLKHLRESWLPSLFYIFVSILIASSSCFVSKDMYEGLGLPEVEEVEQVIDPEAEEPRRTSGRPGKYRVSDENAEGKDKDREKDKGKEE